MALKFRKVRLTEKLIAEIGKENNWLTLELDDEGNTMLPFKSVEYWHKTMECPISGSAKHCTARIRQYEDRNPYVEVSMVWGGMRCTTSYYIQGYCGWEIGHKFSNDELMTMLVGRVKYIGNDESKNDINVIELPEPEEDVDDDDNSEYDDGLDGLNRTALKMICREKHIRVNEYDTDTILRTKIRINLRMKK